MQNAYDVNDTIVAVASASGGAARGIVRISGPETSQCVSQLFHSDCGIEITSLEQASQIRGSVKSPAGNHIPGVLLFWPTKRSYTRQPTAEFHMMGSAPLLQMVIDQVCNTGVRLAQPGEFTLRAFLSGRIDLTQAEAVLAVIDAEEEQQFDAALRQLSGGLAGPLGKLREQLIGVLAELEAGLDFVEEDIEFISKEELESQLSEVMETLDKVIDQVETRSLSNEVCRVVLTGLPNAGKSTLFNQFTNLESAIVSHVAGTTTDYITGRVRIEGTEFEFVDTAGKEESTDAISNEAQAQRKKQTDSADIVLHCIDTTVGVSDWDLTVLESVRAPDIVVLTKHHDVIPNPLQNAVSETGFRGPIVSTCHDHQDGKDALVHEIERLNRSKVLSESPVVAPTVLRVSESLADARAALEHAISATQNELGEEIVAAEIRQSLTDLGRVVGTIYTDDIFGSRIWKILHRKVVSSSAQSTNRQARKFGKLFYLGSLHSGTQRS